MNIGAATGALTSAAGAPLSQSAGAEAERTAKEAATQQRQADAQNKSERASGIGTAEQDEQASDRDADGRRFWEETAKQPEPAPGEPEPPRQAKDPTGAAGNTLDLTG